jgi:hypothetical protein
MGLRAKGDLDPLLVVPAGAGINVFDELLDRGGPPVPRAKIPVFSRPKKPSHAALSGEHPFRDIE